MVQSLSVLSTYILPTVDVLVTSQKLGHVESQDDLGLRA